MVTRRRKIKLRCKPRFYGLGARWVFFEDDFVTDRATGAHCYGRDSAA